MSPRSLREPAPDAVASAVRNTWVRLGQRVRDARLARGWTTVRLGDAAGVSRWLVYLAERGEPVSLEAAHRLAAALGLKLELQLTDPRQASRGTRDVDSVRSAMGELQAGHFRRLGYRLSLDEPYQHYQYAGRADIAVWDATARALLHIENRTRFPDLQDMAGRYNAKRAYFGRVLAERLGVARWDSESHVIAALWSSEVVHRLRLRTESYLALCPDGSAAFERWWSGRPPADGVSSCLVVLDPLAAGRQRVYVGLDEALRTRPRHAGYAAVAARLARRDGR